MSSLDFENSIASWAKWLGSLLQGNAEDTGERLREQLEELFRSHPKGEYTFEHLYSLVSPPSASALAVALDDLAKKATVKLVYRVESPRTHVGLRDFGSISEIPETLYDSSADEDLEIDTNNVRPIFKVA